MQSRLRAVMLSVIARVSLGLAAVAFVWSGLLVVTGGFATTILGLTVRSHNPTRPALVAVLALALFVATHGPRRVRATFASAA